MSACGLGTTPTLGILKASFSDGAFFVGLQGIRHFGLLGYVAFA